MVISNNFQSTKLQFHSIIIAQNVNEILDMQNWPCNYLRKGSEICKTDIFFVSKCAFPRMSKNQKYEKSAL